MSEVNKAFLRAYLKNRATESPTTTPATMDARTPQNQPVARPSASAPRQPIGPTTQPSQMLPSGMNLRFDPPHGEPNAQTRVQPIAVLTTAPRSIEPSNPERVAPKQGVWSSLGAERGMKALERNSNPAVVRNGVNAITSESTQYRQPTTSNAPPTPIVQRGVHSAHSAHSAQPTYDQVMYVDGLVGHTPSQQLTSSRPSDRTLAEITEPIAFGTGAFASPTTTNRLQSEQPHSQAYPVAHGSLDSMPATLPKSRQEVPTRSNEGNPTRRIDAAQQKHTEKVASASATAPAISKTKEPANPIPLPLRVAFNPSWEVDQFFWPEVVKHIETSQLDAFQQIGRHLSLANRDGLKVMTITSGERGVGRSTVAMHMARCAASAGLRVALFDGDTFCPSLVDQLRLDMQQGWQDCLFENVPLQDIAVHSIADGITLFPLTSVISHQQVHSNLHRMAKLVRRISNAFDIVFIDGNRLNLEQRYLIGAAQENVVDAAIVVVDTELSIKEKVDSAVSILQGMGISSIGLVENFQS